jgi:hypothetical protein
MRRWGQFQCFAPIRDRISAAPPRCSPDTRPARESVYLENNREVMPKVCLGPKRTMETNLIYTSVGCPKYVDNTKDIRSQICKDLHISDRISFERETPNWASRSTTMIRKRGYLYLGWRWRQASGAVASRCSGEATQCRQDRGAGEDDRGGRGTPACLRWVLLVRANVLETFSNFYHGIRIRYDDNSISFMIFRIRSHFI